MSNDIFTNVTAHGVRGDGVTDDTSALQDLIDEAHEGGGGTLMFPPGTYVGAPILRESVILQGTQTVHGYAPTRSGSTRLVSPPRHDGYVIDIVGNRAGVRDVDVWGKYGTTYGGVRVAGHNVKLDEIHLANYLGPAVTVTTGNACTLDNMLAFNSLLDRTATANVGVMDIAGNDHYVSRVEANASLRGMSSTAENLSAWVIRGANSFLSNCVGEFSDRGFLVLGSKNRFTGVRADRNFGIGWETRGRSNAYAVCMSVDNSRGSHNTHPAFLTSGTSNVLTGCLVDSLTHERPTYAFEDTVAHHDPGARNTYTGCTGVGVRGTFTSDAWAGSSFDAPAHPVRIVEGGIIPVDQSTVYILAYKESTTITELARGWGGHAVKLISINGRATLANNHEIKTGAGADLRLKADTVYTMTRYNGVWYPSA